MSPAFVWRMEDVLDLYAAEPDPRRPRVCFDERPVQLVAEARCPVPAAPGQPARVDYEYRRNGAANLFLALCPDTGWRRVDVTARRTAQDVAQRLRALVDEDFPDAAVVRLVVDNLNLHTPAVLYAAVPPAEAHRLARKLEFHYTPTHGSWLNMAELGFAALARQCLDRRIPDTATLTHEVAAWEAARNAARATVTWRFTTADARTKLARLYPA